MDGSHSTKMMTNDDEESCDLNFATVRTCYVRTYTVERGCGELWIVMEHVQMLMVPLEPA